MHSRQLPLQANSKPSQAAMCGSATARSVGTYLAGYLGASGTFQGVGISGDTYMKLAGAYQQGQFTKINILNILTFGTSFGPPPYFGEDPYSGRRILEGIEAATKGH